MPRTDTETRFIVIYELAELHEAGFAVTEREVHPPSGQIEVGLCPFGAHHLDHVIRASMG